jgi:hypothetical protein
VNVIRIGSEFEAWHRQTRLAADCLFLPLALLAAQAHLRIFLPRFCGRPKTEATSAMGHKLTWRDRIVMSVLPQQADIAREDRKLPCSSRNPP